MSSTGSMVRNCGVPSLAGSRDVAEAVVSNCAAPGAFVHRVAATAKGLLTCRATVPKIVADLPHLEIVLSLRLRHLSLMPSAETNVSPFCLTDETQVGMVHLPMR